MLKFASNETFEVRTRNQAMTQVKYRMVQALGHEAKDVKINRKSGVIKLNTEEVAEVKEDGSVIFSDTIKDIKEAVETHMQEWVNRRNQPRE